MLSSQQKFFALTQERSSSNIWICLGIPRTKHGGCLWQDLDILLETPFVTIVVIISGHFNRFIFKFIARFPFGYTSWIKHSFPCSTENTTHSYSNERAQNIPMHVSIVRINYNCHTLRYNFVFFRLTWTEHPLISPVITSVHRFIQICVKLPLDVHCNNTVSVALYLVPTDACI